MEINCKNCGISFKTSPAQVSRDNREMCSMDCRKEYTRKNTKVKIYKKFDGRIEFINDLPIDEKLKFIAKCNIHGEFETTISYLRINKYGCQVCAGNKQLIVNDNGKECTKCKEILPLDKFFKVKRKHGFGINHECIECKRKRQRGRIGQNKHKKYGAKYMKLAKLKSQIKHGKMFEHNGKYFTIGLKTDLHRNFCRFCKKSWLNKKPLIYCSKECTKMGSLASRGLKFFLKKINGIKRNYTEKNCIDCNTIFESPGKRCKQCSDLYKKVNEKISKDKAKAKRRARMDIKAERINSYAIFKKDNWTCRMCSTKVQKVNIYADDAAELDHIIPISRGGTHTIDNVQTLCRKCNQFKSDKMPDEVDLINYINNLKNKEIRGHALNLPT